MLFLIVFTSIFLFFTIIVIPYYKEKAMRMADFEEKMMFSIRESMEENALIESGKMPTDEHIQLYYKMYMKKFELDRESNNDWDVSEPMNFEEFEKKAKSCLDTVGGYRFIIGQTMDMFIGGFDGGSMIRYRDYRKMVEKEDE